MKKKLIRLSVLAVIAGTGLFSAASAFVGAPDTHALQSQPDRVAPQPPDSLFGDGSEPKPDPKAKKPGFVVDPLSMPLTPVAPSPSTLISPPIGADAKADPLTTPPVSNDPWGGGTTRPPPALRVTEPGRNSGVSRAEIEVKQDPPPPEGGVGKIEIENQNIMAPAAKPALTPPKMPDWLQPWWEAVKNIVPGSEFANLPGGKEALGIVIAKLNKKIVEEQLKDSDGKPNNLEFYEQLKAKLQNIYNGMPDDD